jgi:hypothetical protein
MLVDLSRSVGKLPFNWLCPGNLLFFRQLEHLLLYLHKTYVSIISLSVLMTWIFCHTAKSLIPMVLIHFSFNASLILAGPGGMGQVPALTLWTFLAVLYLLTAIVVVLASGLRKSPAFMMAQ